MSQTSFFTPMLLDISGLSPKGEDVVIHPGIEWDKPEHLRRGFLSPDSFYHPCSTAYSCIVPLTSFSSENKATILALRERQSAATVNKYIDLLGHPPPSSFRKTGTEHQASGACWGWGLSSGSPKPWLAQDGAPVSERPAVRAGAGAGAGPAAGGAAIAQLPQPVSLLLLAGEQRGSIKSVQLAPCPAGSRHGSERPGSRRSPGEEGSPLLIRGGLRPRSANEHNTRLKISQFSALNTNLKWGNRH